MEMVMKFPNGETRNLLIEVFNYKRVCALQICYTSGFGGQRHGHELLLEWWSKGDKMSTFAMYVWVACTFTPEICPCSCSEHVYVLYVSCLCKRVKLPFSLSDRLKTLSIFLYNLALKITYWHSCHPSIYYLSPLTLSTKNDILLHFHSAPRHAHPDFKHKVLWT